MSAAATHQAAATAACTPSSGLLLQRKCACGSARTAWGSDCADCARKKLLGVQRKLAIGRTDGPLELEADRAADVVLRGPVAPAAPALEPLALQSRAGTPCAGEAPASVQAVLSGSGQPIAPALRRDMEQRFGHDFGSVRIHADAAAADSAREIDAHAYTSGPHIAFGAGAYSPGTHAGRRLLAHELAHVVQQGASPGLAPYVARAWNACGAQADCPPRAAGEVAQARRRPWLIGQLTSPETGQLVAHFDIGSSDTSSLVRNPLWQALATAIAGGDLHWELLGFSDCEGRDAGNRGLRQARADAVASLLPPAARAKLDRVAGADLADCVAENNTPEFRALNRSVVFRPTATVLDFDPVEVEGEVHATICGPDVTAQVESAVAEARTAFSGWDRDERDEACDALDSVRTGSCAWDIVELHNNAWIHQDFRPSCATQGATPACGETVQVGSECFYSGSPNYVIFGTMCKLCAEHYLGIPLINTGFARFTRASMTALIDIYKGSGVTGLATPSGNYRESRAWALAGYEGWPAGGTPPAGDRPGCAPVCGRPYAGSFRVHWHPHLPRETCR